MMKKLTMWKGHRCSLQYHNIKCETIYILSGQLCIYSGPSQDQLESRVFGPGETITLTPRVIHRMEAVEDSVYLEASTPEMDDVVRLFDDYQRAP
jgi:mannose-6-phosphate isomerase